MKETTQKKKNIKKINKHSLVGILFTILGIAITMAYLGYTLIKINSLDDVYFQLALAIFLFIMSMILGMQNTVVINRKHNIMNAIAVITLISFTAGSYFLNHASTNITNFKKIALFEAATSERDNVQVEF